MIWPYIPQVGMLETVEWMTDVIEAYEGEEQRIRLRNAPRHGYQTKYNVLSSRAKNLIMWHGEFDLPLWQYAAPVNVTAGATSIAVDTRYADYQGTAVLWQDEFNNELVTVSGKTDSSLTVSEVQDNCSGYVMPSRKARLLQDVSVVDRTGKFNQPTLVWRALENYTLTPFEPGQYNGHDVVTWPTLLSGDSVEREFVRPLEWIDYGTGLVEVDSRLDFSRFGTKAVRGIWQSPQEIWEFRRWLHALGGQVNPFWLPTFADDLTITQDYGASDTVITVARVDYTTIKDQIKHLAFFLPDGSTLYRQVVDSAISGAEEVIQLNAALGVAGGPATRISYMPLVRLAGDRVELNWNLQDQVETAFAVRGLNA
jgi:hypothetical protein